MFITRPLFMRSLCRSAALILGALATVAPVATLEAQNASLRGVVVTDSGKRPLANAEVLLSNLDRSTRTDAAGRFAFQGVKAGKHNLVVRLVGYEPINTTLTFDSSNALETEVVLQRTGTQLATVSVRGKLETLREATFDENRRNSGKFLTRETFEQGNGRPLIALITRNISGLSVVNAGGQSVLTSTRSNQNGRNCYLQVIVNNVDMTRTGLFDLNTVNSLNVIGVEYYTAALTPAKYNQMDGNAKCGTVVVWTKD
jgi:hypothetical protein